MKIFKQLRNIFSSLSLYIFMVFAIVSNTGYCINNVLSLTASSGQYQDETLIRLENQSTFSFDGNWDAYKLSNGGSTPNLYTSLSGTNYSINSVPEDSNVFTIPLDFKAAFDGTYLITTKYLDSTFDTTYSVTLEDKLLNITQDLRQNGIYQFDAMTSDGVNRFAVHFIKYTTPGIVNGLTSNVVEKSFEITTNSNGIDINLYEVESGVSIGIINMEGQILYEMENISTPSSVNVPFRNNSQGNIYMIKIISGNRVFYKKVSLFH